MFNDKNLFYMIQYQDESKSFVMIVIFISHPIKSILQYKLHSLYRVRLRGDRENSWFCVCSPDYVPVGVSLCTLRPVSNVNKLLNTNLPWFKVQFCSSRLSTLSPKYPKTSKTQKSCQIVLKVATAWYSSWNIVVVLMSSSKNSTREKNLNAFI